MNKIIWSFFVQSASEIETASKGIDQCKLDYELNPIFNGSNLEFINKYVLLDNQEIMELRTSKKQVFSNRVLNRNFYGKVNILASGNKQLDYRVMW